MNSCVQPYIEKNGFTAALGKVVHSDKTLTWGAPYDQLRLGVKKKRKIEVIYADGSHDYKNMFKTGCTNFYIAGSNIKVRGGNYDIMQGTLPEGYGKVSTTHDFWTSITMRASPIIVTVNDPEEKRAVRGYPETTEYWKESLFPLKLENDWTVVREGDEELIATSNYYPDTKIVKRTFVAMHADKEPQTITQFHYLGWPDSLGPSDYELLEALHEAVDKESTTRALSKKSPITAHCGNGLGRSALFAISHLFHREIQERVSAGEQIDTMELDVINTIYEFNKQRPLQLSEGVQWQGLFVALRRMLLKHKGESNKIIRAFEEKIEQKTFAKAAEKLESAKKKLIKENNMSFDVIMIKSFPSSTRLGLENQAEKKYVSTSGKPLSDVSIEKAKKLGEFIQKMGPFAGVFSAESATSYGSALYAADAPPVIVKGFNQIRLGVFEGVEAGDIQKAYTKAHPTAAFVPEPNDCLNKPWPNLPADAFESYDDVDARVLDAFKALSVDAKGDNSVFVVSAAKEPVRSIMLHSTLAESVRNSQFYKDLVMHIQREPGVEQPIGEFAVRGQLNPKDGSWIRLHYENGKISLVAVSEDVEFRKMPPVPGYFRELK